MKLFKSMCGLSLILFAIQFIASTFFDPSFSQKVGYFFVAAQGFLFFSYILLFGLYTIVRVNYNKRKQVSALEKTPTVQKRSHYHNRAA